MRKATTTQKLQQAITKNLLIVKKVEMYHKSTRQTNEITADTFRDSLYFLCETIFSDALGWHYERDYKTNAYIAECGRMDPDSEIIISVCLRVADGDANVEDIEKGLNVTEEE